MDKIILLIFKQRDLWRKNYSASAIAATSLASVNARTDIANSNIVFGPITYRPLQGAFFKYNQNPLSWKCID